MEAPEGAIPIDQFQPAQAAPMPQNHGASGAIPIDQFKSAEDTYGSAGQQALGVAEGLSQGLAGPFATGAERALSELGVPGLSPHAQEMRKQTNPIGSYGSEAAGFGLGAFFGTGEAAALSKAGEAAVGAANLGKAVGIGQKAAQGAVRTAAEIASLQTLNETSRFINQDPNQTLGSAAINIGLAGVLGGAGGAVLGSVSPMWKAFTNRAAESEGVGAIQAAEGEDLLTRSIQKPKERESFLRGMQKQKENAAEILKSGEELGVPVGPSQTSASDYVQSMDSALSQSPTLAGVARKQEIDDAFEQIGKRLEPIVGSAEETTPFQRGQTIKNQIQETVDNMYQPLKEKYADRLAYAQHIEIPDAPRLKQYDKLVELSQGIGEVGSKEGAYVREIAERMLPQNSVANLDKFISKLGTEQRMARISGNTDLAHAIGQASESIQDFQINQIAKTGAAMQAEGAEHAAAIASDIIKEHKALKSEYANFKEILTDFLSDARLGKKGNTAGGIEQVLENIPNEKLVEKLFDPKNAAGLMRLREKFPQVFKTVIDGKKADLLNAAMKGGELSHKTLLTSIEKLSPEVRELMFNPQELKTIRAAKTWIDSLPKNVGPSGTPKGSAYMAALHSHPLATIVNNAKDFGIKTLLKFSTPAEIEANKVTSDYIQHAIKGERALDRAAKAFFQTGELIPKHLLPTESSRKRLADSLEKVKDPNQAMEVGAGIGHHLPAHQAGATMLAAQAAQYLNALKPNEAPATPFDKAPPIDKAAKAKYDRALDVANQPLLVLQHAKDGTLLPQDIQTIQAIYPSLHASMVHKLSDQLADHKAHDKPLSYQQRKGISIVLGSPIDSTMMPQNMQAIIQTSGGQMQQQTGKPPRGHSSQSTLSQINKVNAQYETPLEARATHRNR